MILISDIKLFKYFEAIYGSRQQSKVVHKLFDIIFLAINAVVPDFRCWEDIENFYHNRLDWLRKYISPTQGIPLNNIIAD
ncbi:transposase family protein [Pseudoalteromonas sp. BSi20652]|uniref:transposase family protein n=1 Tax=Pseudoalteromonas sp. BSi20652 TaxID=388384 RepID=UPI000A079F33